MKLTIPRQKTSAKAIRITVDFLRRVLSPSRALIGFWEDADGSSGMWRHRITSSPRRDRRMCPCRETHGFKEKVKSLCWEFDLYLQKIKKDFTQLPPCSSN